MAVKTLLGWYREGVDVDSRLAALSTYLGHLNPASGYGDWAGAVPLIAALRRGVDHPAVLPQHAAA